MSNQMSGRGSCTHDKQFLSRVPDGWAGAALSALAAVSAAANPGPVPATVSNTLAAAAWATVEGTRLYGDAYLVTDGAKTYSVLDVYIKATQSTDIVASVYGASAYKASWKQNQNLCFRHAGDSGWKPNYIDAAGAAWDSFVTLGLRTQSNDGDGGTLTAVTADPGFSNMNSTNPTRITGPSTGNGPGWYPAAGATPSSNPYCVFGYYNGASNIAKANATIAGNGVAAGSSLDNMFMIARVTMDTADMVAGTTYQYKVQFAMTVVSDGVTRTGSTNTSFRVNQSPTFALGPCTAGSAAEDCNADGVKDSCQTSATTDTDNDGKLDTCERRRGDLDLSGTIDAADIGALLLIWDDTPAWGDLDGDGRISGGDLAEILLKFGQQV
jgi:hypothetical protein